MPTDVVSALISALVGGLMVAFINFLFMRKRIDAEIKKFNAESRKANLEADKIEQEKQIEFLESLLERAAQKALERYGTQVRDNIFETPFSYKQNYDLERLLTILANLLPKYLEQQELLETMKPQRKTK